MKLLKPLLATGQYLPAELSRRLGGAGASQDLAYDHTLALLNLIGQLLLSGALLHRQGAVHDTSNPTSTSMQDLPLSSLPLFYLFLAQVCHHFQDSQVARLVKSVKSSFTAQQGAVAMLDADVAICLSTFTESGEALRGRYIDTHASSMGSLVRQHLSRQQQQQQQQQHLASSSSASSARLFTALLPELRRVDWELAQIYEETEVRVKKGGGVAFDTSSAPAPWK
eukprot:CAMPEP_0175139446 /NCGR_PEP_ID=MMETSP0087-20121206/10907_1 /TAXON_ID=136419 /ORGANISM="Unknown Unknown, Strain D1" /LENGTH=224 /DNA_ID=CAMNT_0016422457 /DNA_START=95 /DNA_END=766 /DNA_ORIENTATION=+